MAPLQRIRCRAGVGLARPRERNTARWYGGTNLAVQGEGCLVFAEGVGVPIRFPRPYAISASLPRRGRARC